MRLQNRVDVGSNPVGANYVPCDVGGGGSLEHRGPHAGRLSPPGMPAVRSGEGGKVPSAKQCSA